MAQQGSGDGLLRWLLGGLAAGAVVLGLLIAAYAIGYHRGQHHPRRAAAPATPTTTQPATTPTKPTPPASPAQLLAAGKRLFSADGCSACHSLTGAAGVGPTLKGLAGSDVALITGQRVKADGAYLAKSITDADAQIVTGYGAGIMSTAVKGFDLSAKPADVQALVAFVTAQR